MLIEDPEKFTRSHSARTSTGDPTVPTAGDAVKWDASGALMRVTGHRSNVPGFSYLVEAAGGFRKFVELTTRGTHADVLKLYDRAIRLADGGGGDATG